MSSATRQAGNFVPATIQFNSLLIGRKTGSPVAHAKDAQALNCSLQFITSTPDTHKQIVCWIDESTVY